MHAFLLMLAFADGQTGSGKTFTMRGNDEDPGMMILCIRDIFDYIATHPKRAFELRVSYMEVYNEEINDLLGSGPVIPDISITMITFHSNVYFVEFKKSSYCF
jgi:hypothetical protein